MTLLTLAGTAGPTHNAWLVWQTSETGWKSFCGSYGSFLKVNGYMASADECVSPSTLPSTAASFSDDKAI